MADISSAVPTHQQRYPEVVPVLGIDPRPSAPAVQGLGTHDYPEDAATNAAEVSTVDKVTNSLSEAKDKTTGFFSKGIRKMKTLFAKGPQAASPESVRKQ
eukprot:ANDGO_06030.mRNA.1 hypothetical protein